MPGILNDVADAGQNLVTSQSKDDSKRCQPETLQQSRACTIVFAAHSDKTDCPGPLPFVLPANVFVPVVYFCQTASCRSVMFLDLISITCCYPVRLNSVYGSVYTSVRS